jgi:hypothetical protein
MRHLLLSECNLSATHETVRLILKQLDPASVAYRRHNRLMRRTYVSRGPNHCWHVDGYDKLVPYGFGISGLVFQKRSFLIFVNCYMIGEW